MKKQSIVWYWYTSITHVSAVGLDGIARSFGFVGDIKYVSHTWEISNVGSLKVGNIGGPDIESKIRTIDIIGSVG